MSIRAKFLGLIDVVLRIPPLFLLDEILKMNIFFDNTSQLDNFENSNINKTLADEIASNSTDSLISSSIDFYGLSWILAKIVLFLFGKFANQPSEIIEEKEE